jgi:hypothetical protein
MSQDIRRLLVNPNINEPPIPLLQHGEQRLIKLRTRLEKHFEELSLAHDVVCISVQTLARQRSDYDPEVAHVLTRCVVDKMHGQLRSVAHIIQQLGGAAHFPVHSTDDEETDNE